jgi:hypothetical protein
VIQESLVNDEEISMVLLDREETSYYQVVQVQKAERHD